MPVRKTTRIATIVGQALQIIHVIHAMRAERRRSRAVRARAGRRAAAARPRRARRRGHDPAGRGVDGARRRRARRAVPTSPHCPARSRPRPIRGDPRRCAGSSALAGPTCCTRTPRRQARPGDSRRSLAGRRARGAVVHTFHGHVLSGYFDPARARVPLLERVLAWSTDALVAVSDEVRDDLVRLRVAPTREDRRHPVRLRPRCARRRRAAEARAPTAPSSAIAEEHSSIGWAGRLTAIKRPLDLVRVAAARRRRRVLVLAGDGELRADVERLAERARRLERVPAARLRRRPRGVVRAHSTCSC